MSAVLVSVAAVSSQAPPLPKPTPRPPATKPAEPQRPREPSVTPRFEAVAETRLLMEGLALPNYRALEKALRAKPADDDAWTFARGQALIIAETGNLLLLRPPRNQGRDVWMQRAMDLRQAATALARAGGSKDLDGSRKAFVTLTGTCNHCHETFRVKVRVGPTEKDGGRDVD
jgi:hypothetical protein